MKNLEIRELIQKSRVKHWEIANMLNISEYTFCKKLRRELPQEEKAKIVQAIEKLKIVNNKED